MDKSVVIRIPHTWLAAGSVFLWIALGLQAPAARAQSFPAKMVSLVVPAAPGGATGAISFLLAERLTELWRVRTLVDNKPGGNHQIAANYVAKAPPDGHVLLLSAEAAFVINQFLYRKLSYDPAKDFVPVSGIASSSQGLIVHASVPAGSVRELVELARASPGAVHYGTTGPGSTGHLNAELLAGLAGVKFTPVHYNGAGPAVKDVMGGHIQMMVVSLGLAVPPTRGGQARMLAIGAAVRLPAFPDVPTVAESGFPGYEATTWFGLFAPAGTPPAIVSRINADVQRVLNDPAVVDKHLSPLHFAPMPGSPERFSAFIEAERQKWRKVVSAANITLD